MHVTERPSPNHRVRPDGVAVDTLVLHYTGMTSAAAAIERLRDPVAAVSPPSGVDADAPIYLLVPHERRAAHAGISFWRGVSDLNDRSVGIEIVNPGHEWGYRPFPDIQIEAVAALARRVLERHPIPPRNVVGHSDVAPDRKQDPGELFPWRALAREGIGIWPADDDADALDAGPADPAALDAALDGIGYPAVAPEIRIAAFQRRWRQARVDGLADQGTTRRADAVLARLGSWRTAG